MQTLFHTVYKTTNLVNGKYYFGYHKTGNPQDSYLGSGKYLRNAIAKYGAVNFKKDVLFTYSDAAPAFNKEAELVGGCIGDLSCMNLKRGGSGGFDWINAHKPNGLDLVGKKFGLLTVIGLVGLDKHGSRLWAVRCGCGVSKTVTSGDLQSGKTMGCGRCLKIEDLLGQKFGHLLVVAYRGSRKGAIWDCRCECGAVKGYKARALKRGDAKSCGCLHPKRPKIGFGQQFGRLSVVSRTDNSESKRSRWVVKCECGTVKEVLGASLCSGATQSCGCLRKEIASKARHKC
jgi:hypothetical protein